VGAGAVQISDVPEQLEKADIVISSTASQLPILGKGATESALKKRKHKPIFMVDLAVPRDIETEVGNLDDIYLYTIDDLNKVVDKNQHTRILAAEAAQEIINLEVKTFEQWLVTHQAADEIRQLRASADQIKQQCFDRVLAQYQQDHDAEKALQRLANTLTNKMLHGPTIEMRKALRSDDQATIRLLQSLISSD
jgi:glutamyl-tRNA reductase